MRTKSASVAGVVFSLFTVFGPMNAHAAASSVGVAIHFEVAPAELFRARAIEPAKVRSCEVLKAKVDAVWVSPTRQSNRGRPELRCSSQTAMPLIVTNDSGSALIVRP